MGTKAPSGAGGEGESPRGRGVWYDILVSNLFFRSTFWSAFDDASPLDRVLALQSHLVVFSDYG